MERGGSINRLRKRGNIVSCDHHDSHRPKLSDLLTWKILISVKPALEKSVDTVVQPDVPVECRIKRSNPSASISWQMQPYCHISAQECLPQSRLWETVVGEQFQINSTTRLSQLKVSASYKRDFFFRCIASNKVGNDSHLMKFLYFREGSRLLLCFLF